MDVNRNYLRDEQELIRELTPLAGLGKDDLVAVNARATALVESVRADEQHRSPLDRLLGEYDLGSEEGVLLMCLAESLLRIPDHETQQELIADKLGDVDWASHLGNDDFLVNASTWGLMLTGKLLPELHRGAVNLQSVFQNLVSRIGEPLVRIAISHGIDIIGDQFVMGESIDTALARSLKISRPHECFSFDMLGEAAFTADDAARYCDAYRNAIAALGSASSADDSPARRGISVKLSALYPRFVYTQSAGAVHALRESLEELVALAFANNVNLTVDAEESDRLTMMLEIFEAVARDTTYRSWNGLGFAVQAYQKRALDVVVRIASFAESTGRKLRIRLVKGAYWDSEIKWAQVHGLVGYPVFTRKCHTDISYLACVRALRDHTDTIDALFATHNAYTVAYVEQVMGDKLAEFQRLHGMGDALYEAVNANRSNPRPCRVYAPVGVQRKLLPYLMRRLLENGANTSFVHRIADQRYPTAQLTRNPVDQARAADFQPHPRIPLPADLFAPTRKNSLGVNFADPNDAETLLVDIHRFAEQLSKVTPLIEGRICDGAPRTVFSPANPQRAVGEVIDSDRQTVLSALERADARRLDQPLPAVERAAILNSIADRLEARRAELIGLAAHETGRTIVDLVAEVREAIDFCRYYASECVRLFDSDRALPGPVGEENTASFKPLGVVVCISPWNFPISIFCGQVAGAFAAGNIVIAKPSEFATLSAHLVVQIFLEAGLPATLLSFVPGGGSDVGQILVEDPRVDGIVFTGSNRTAKHINRRLAARETVVPRVIAETGGINAMVVDSSAMVEQVVQDVVVSGFNSAGQRCSSLRALYLNADIADSILEMLIGHMRELVIDDSLRFHTDIGPVITEASKTRLETYVASVVSENRLIFQQAVPSSLAPGHFFGPCLVSIDHISQIPDEIFGPVVHVRKFNTNELESICTEINQLDYALTFGIHSRIGHRIEYFRQRIRAGNIYVNRNMIGAVVESQPFGGSRLSGTGPKAGGAHYLHGLSIETSTADNIAAVGGNVSLLTID